MEIIMGLIYFDISTRLGAIYLNNHIIKLRSLKWKIKCVSLEDEAQDLNFSGGALSASFLSLGPLPAPFINLAFF